MAPLFQRNKKSRPVVNDADQDAPQSGDDPAPRGVDGGLQKTRASLRTGLRRLLGNTVRLDDAVFDRLEEFLITSDIGVQASMGLVEELREISSRKAPETPAALIRLLAEEIEKILSVAEQEWLIEGHPYVIMIVGVNGVGKTTTIAKIAHRLSKAGHSVMLAAADTFRAAAVGQLREWGERLDIPVIAQGEGADAAAVAHDAISAAIARGSDVLLIDTAGRLHTQTDLMQQLEKMQRVLSKISPEAPHEVMQVIDAGTGQNAILQLRSFNDSIGVDSVAVTKLDGSARGGVLLALTREFGLPVRFIGVGETFEDLRPFRANEYTHALMPEDLLDQSSEPDDPV